MATKRDLTGQRYGKLTVLKYSHSNHRGRAMWLCQCDCGNETVVLGNALTQGNTKTCGCSKVENATKLKYKHGYRSTRLYRIWLNMHTRCSNEQTNCYTNYGKRGIKICNEWQEFLPFYEWAMANGYRDDLTIDRIDNNGNYCPENCRWSTRVEQSNNTRKNHFVTYNGQTHTIAEWAKITGLSRSVITQRINKSKWSVEKALTTPVKGRKI